MQQGTAESLGLRPPLVEHMLRAVLGNYHQDHHGPSLQYDVGYGCWCICEMDWDNNSHMLTPVAKGSGQTIMEAIVDYLNVKHQRSKHHG